MRAFTLIETLIVITIIAVLAGASVPFYSYFQNFSVIESVKQEVLENMRLAQSKAKAGVNDSAFGLYFSGGQYVIYQGDTYAGRDQSQDFVNELPANVVFSGLAEITFSKNIGQPSNNGTIILTNTSTNIQKQIIVNSQGLID